VVGGEGAHLGAVSLAERRGEDGTVRSGTLGALGHREPDLIGEIARSLGEATGRRVVVTGGIHIDAAVPDEIERIFANARSAARELARALTGRDP
jgi:hypothetical protein